MTRQERLGFVAVFAVSVLALMLEQVNVAGQFVFVVAAVAVAGLAWLLGEATEHAGETSGARVSALLNASFGNLPEVVILVLAINSGLLDIARASIIGSVIGNVLLILGLSLIIGGWRHGIQTFNQRLAAMNSSMLVFAVAGLGLPTLFITVHHSATDAALMSRWTAVALFVAYVAYVYGTFTMPGVNFRSVGGASHWSRTQALVLLGVTAIGTGVVSEVLVKSIEPTVRAWGVPRPFIGLIVVPLVGNVAEHFSAVRLAWRGSLDFAMGIALGSAIQIALLASSVAVLASALIGNDMTLAFPALELGALGAAAILSMVVARNGETNWLEGLQLLTVYFIVAVAFWLLG